MDPLAAPSNITLLTAEQVADILGVDDRTIRRLMQSGDLVAVNVGAGRDRPRWRYLPEDVAAFVESRRTSEGAVS